MRSERLARLHLPSSAEKHPDLSVPFLPSLICWADGALSDRSLRWPDGCRPQRFSVKPNILKYFLYTVSVRQNSVG